MESTKHPSAIIRFGNFEVDPRAGELRKHGVRIKLQEQPIQLLLLLLERPGEVVTREEARKALWKDDTFVDWDHGLGVALNRLRAALGDSANNPRFIETLPRRGFRFIETVAAGSPPERGPVEVRATVDPGHPAKRPLALLALVLAVLGLSIYMMRQREQAPIGIHEGKNMLLVLPFDNLSADPEQEYFCDGLTEELITHVGSLSTEKLGVIARTSSMAYKKTTKTIDRIGQELGVNYVLEGSVRREGERVRIAAQLISVKDQTHLWAKSYDREITGILALQDEVSRSVTEAVAGELSLDRMAIPHDLTDGHAYEAYLKGRHHWNMRDSEGFQKGIEYFQEAIAIDPEFAAAYAGLADCYALLGNHGLASLPPREAQSKARAMATKALEIDPNLAEAHASLALVALAYDWDWQAAADSFQRAIQLNPSYATAYHWHALHLTAVGRFDEAIDKLRLARDLDPLSLIVNTELGRVFYLARRHSEAIEQLQETLRLDADFDLARLWLSIARMQAGTFVEANETPRARAAMETRGPTLLALLGAHLAAAGKETEALEIIEELKESSAERLVPPADFAMLYANLGDADQAFAWLDRAFEERSVYLVWLKVDPVFDPLRSDERFDALVRRMNFPE